MLNLTRGTGIAGLHGILPKNGPLVRPLLFLTRDEINELVKKLKKESNERNQEHIKQHRKEYYEQNKEKILDKCKELYTCECGKELTYSHKSRHLKSKTHLDYINNKNNI